MESLKNQKPENNIMSEESKLIESLSTKNGSLSEKVTTLTEKVTDLEGQKKTTETKLSETEAKLKESEEAASKHGSLDKLGETLKSLGMSSIDELAKFLEGLDQKTVALFSEGKVKFADLGLFQESGFEAFQTEVTNLREKLAKFTDINEDAEKLSEELKDLQEKVKAFDEIGTPEEITEAMDDAENLLKKYREIGTPEEITESMEMAQATLDKIKEKNDAKTLETKVEAFSKEHKITLELAESLLTKMDEDEAVAVVESMPGHTPKKKEKEDLGEGEDKPRTTRAGRLFESMTTRSPAKD